VSLASEVLVFDVLDTDLQFTANTIPDQNPDMVKRLLEELPFTSTLGHVVVSGEGIWTPTRIVTLGNYPKVQRTQGSVYFYSAGQSLCFTYGAITESALVNKIAQVPDDQFDALGEVGRYVWRRTVTDNVRSKVSFQIRRAAA
jgi:hypothetical protein